MSRDKQIEEMVKTLNEATFGVNKHIIADHIKKPEAIEEIVTHLYNAGYRKSTDVASEIFAEIEEKLSANLCGEFRGDSIEWFDYFSLLLAEDIAELKKKYTEGYDERK